MRAFAHSVSLFIAALVSAGVFAAAEDAVRQHGLGDRPPTREEQAYLDAHLTEVQKVLPNDLSIERAKCEAIAMGLPVEDAGSLAASVDNSTLMFFPPVRDQGDQELLSKLAEVHLALTFSQRDADEILQAACGAADREELLAHLNALFADATDSQEI